MVEERQRRMLETAEDGGRAWRRNVWERRLRPCVAVAMSHLPRLVLLLWQPSNTVFIFSSVQLAKKVFIRLFYSYSRIGLSNAFTQHSEQSLRPLQRPSRQVACHSHLCCCWSCACLQCVSPPHEYQQSVSTSTYRTKTLSVRWATTSLSSNTACIA
jgi:hypothetical protein